MNNKANGLTKADGANGRPASKCRGVLSPTTSPQLLLADQNTAVINATPKKVDAPPPTNGDCWLNLAFYKKYPPKLNPLTRTLQKWPRMDPANRTFNYPTRRRYNTDEGEFDTIIQDLQKETTFTHPSPNPKPIEIPDNYSILKTADGYSIITEKIPLLIFGNKAKIADLAALQKTLKFYTKNGYDKFDNNCLFFQKEYTSHNTPFFPTPNNLHPNSTQNTDPNNPPQTPETLHLIIDIDQSHKNSINMPIKKIRTECIPQTIHSIDHLFTATETSLAWVTTNLKFHETDYNSRIQKNVQYGKKIILAIQESPQPKTPQNRLQIFQNFIVKFTHLLADYSKIENFQI